MNKSNSITCYRPDWLIDGSGSPAVKYPIFCIKDQFFHKILYSNTAKMSLKHIINMPDCTVLPCFIDTHVHLAFSGTTNFNLRKQQLKKNYAKRKDVISNNIRQHLLCGVAAVRDGGDPNNDVLKFKHSFLTTKGPHLFISSPGSAWYSKNRYGGFIGIPLEFSTSLNQSLILNGIYRDHIKLINSGINSLIEVGAETLPQFELDEIKLAVDVASSIGKKVMIHANGSIPVKYAVRAGCHSVEHGFFMGISNLMLMAQKAVTWVPTVFTMKACIDYFKKKKYKGETSIVDVALKNLEHQLEQLTIAKKKGVIVALGTDAGSPGVDHGFSIKEEMKLLIESGYTVEEAVQCATINGAKLIGCFDMGLVAEGMKANFIVVRGKPINIIDSLDNIDYVFWEGKRMI